MQSVTCFKCGEKGHYANVVSQNTHYSLLFLSHSFHEVYACECYVVVFPHVWCTHPLVVCVLVLQCPNKRRPPPAGGYTLPGVTIVNPSERKRKRPEEGMMGVHGYPGAPGPAGYAPRPLQAMDS